MLFCENPISEKAPGAVVGFDLVAPVLYLRNSPLIFSSAVLFFSLFLQTTGAYVSLGLGINSYDPSR